MLGIVKEISGQKQIIPLTTDAGTGAPVGTLIQQYKKKPMSGYLYCDGSTFDQNAYPALYMYLGTNVLPDYRECVMVGAEQNTTDTIATHDVYGEGEFKDDQLQNHRHLVKDTVFGSPVAYGMDAGDSAGVVDRTVTAYLTNRAWEAAGAGYLDTVSRYGETTHGKQKAVYVYIKATSGLAENQQDNVLNDVKDYVDNSIDDKVGRYTLTASRTSNGWSATKDLSNLPVGIYKVTAMHSSSGAITEALVLRTGYDYLVQDTYKTGSIGVSCSNDVLTVSETTSSIGVVVVSLYIVGTK